MENLPTAGGEHLSKPDVVAADPVAFEPGLPR
jgi:hypothetical protein